MFFRCRCLFLAGSEQLLQDTKESNATTAARTAASINGNPFGSLAESWLCFLCFEIINAHFVFQFIDFQQLYVRAVA